jgi:hypothetical protein
MVGAMLAPRHLFNPLRSIVILNAEAVMCNLSRAGVHNDAMFIVPFAIRHFYFDIAAFLFTARSNRCGAKAHLTLLGVA